MPHFSCPDADIYYERHGDGFPVLMLGPGYLNSGIGFWDYVTQKGVADWKRILPENGFSIVAMDQRTAGRSRTALNLTHGWHTFVADQIALMDHLGIDRFHVIGGSIGANFSLRLAAQFPNRVVSAAVQYPIGRSATQPERFFLDFGEWLKLDPGEDPDLKRSAWEIFSSNMFNGDFLFNLDREDVQQCTTPVLLCPGNDAAHPAEIGFELMELLPDVEIISRWMGPSHLDEQSNRVIQFFRKNELRLAGASQPAHVSKKQAGFERDIPAYGR